MQQKIVNPFKHILLPYQWDIFADKHPYKVLNCSRQIGKSLTIAAIAVQRALTMPGTLHLIISVNQRSASELLMKVKQWAEACKLVSDDKIRKAATDYEASYDKVKFANGSRIITLPSGNPSACRGWSATTLICDEWAICENDTEIWTAISPSMTSKMNGSDKMVILASTPTSKNTEFAKAYFDNTGFWKRWTITIEDAVKGGLKADIEALRRLVNDDQIFDIEYRCQFATSYFDAFDTSKVMAYKELPPGVQTRYFGYDPARTNDGSAMVTLVEIAGKLYIEEADVYINTPYYQQLETIKQKNAAKKYSSGYVDAVGQGNMIAEETQRTVNSRIKPLVWTSTNKPQIYERLKQTVANGELYCHQDILDKVVNDMAQVKRVISDTGKIIYDAKRTSETRHSDISSALALALEAMHEMPKNATQPVTHIPFSSFGPRAGVFCRY